MYVCMYVCMSALRTLSAVQWDSLWSIPNDPFLAPFQKDILWKFLHRVLPTHYRMHRWGLSQSADCLACHSSTPDTIDHASTEIVLSGEMFCREL